MNTTHICSIAIYLLLLYGIGVRRRDRRRHRFIMIAACVFDVALVGWLEISRHAVEKSLGIGGFAPPGPLLTFHIIVSVGCLILYGAQIAGGIRMGINVVSATRMHFYLGVSFMILRTLSLVTSFVISK